MRLLALYVHDKANATGVMFKLRIVQTPVWGATRFDLFFARSAFKIATNIFAILRFQGQKNIIL